MVALLCRVACEDMKRFRRLLKKNRISPHHASMDECGRSLVFVHDCDWNRAREVVHGH